MTRVTNKARELATRFTQDELMQMYRYEKDNECELGALVQLGVVRKSQLAKINAQLLANYPQWVNMQTSERIDLARDLAATR
jgi:ribosomal protein L39E